MQKLVNVYTKQVIRSLKGVPIRSTIKGIYLDTEDIRTCIIAKAIVEEILDDGSTIPLNFANYNKDNNAQFKNQPAPLPKKEKKAAKVEEPAPVVEETPVAETIVEEAPVVEETVAEAPAEEAPADEEAAQEATEETADETAEDKPRKRKRNN